ncbi:hypothetical protein ACSDQ9_09995 [Aestuariimicrobium soli]|uniref:hypothetical protein n=1 Tax=Aestuariimicrobium soli TaxID=2035834 RepID=UPI003EBB51CC
MSEPWTPDDPLLLRATAGRGSRQLLVLVPGMLLFVGMLVIGVMSLVFGWQQGWRSAGFWMAGAVGWMFVGLGLACLISGAEAIVRTLWARSGTPVLQVDARGVGDGRRPPISWSDLRTVVVISQDSPYRRGKYGAMDRAVGEPLKVRDGHRAIRLERRDGSSRVFHLTLPIGPDEFARAAEALIAFGARAGVPVEVTDDLSRRFA